MRKLIPALAMALSMWCLPARAGESNLLGSAPGRIEKFRTRQVTLQVLDEQGRPAPGKFPIEMVRHQFLFGCNLFLFGKFSDPKENQRYLELYRSLFNYATVPFYLATYQPAPDQTRETEVRAMAKWCAGQGIKVKGHPLIWHYPAGNPAWLPDDPEAVEALHRARILEVVKNFSPEIQYWDILNEPTVAWMYDTPVAKWERKIGPLAAAKKGLAWAREANPEARLLINDYNVRFGTWSLLDYLHPFLSLKRVTDGVPNYGNSYYRFLADLKRQGGNFSALGIQSHMHMGGNWSMDELWRTCERYARLGVPIHFTELTVLSGQAKIMWPFNPEVNLPWPSTPAGEARQAEYVEKFYTVLFSHPAVGAITWWDFSDRDAWMGAPAGLIREDLSPKPAYDRLVELVRKKWWTRLEGVADDRGQLTFRGYCGDYQLFLPDGRALPFSIDCKVEGPIRISVSAGR